MPATIDLHFRAGGQALERERLFRELPADIQKLVRKKFPSVQRRALNSYGFALRTRLNKFVGSEAGFDRPKPFTSKGYRVVPAKTVPGTMTVGPTGRVARVLLVQAQGGHRDPSYGRLLNLPSNLVVVPGPAAKLDRFGGLSKTYLAGRLRRAESGQGFIDRRPDGFLRADRTKRNRRELVATFKRKQDVRYDRRFNPERFFPLDGARYRYLRDLFWQQAGRLIKTQFPKFQFRGSVSTPRPPW